MSALPTHPRTGLHAVGVLPSGRIVWPVMGAEDNPPEPPAPPADPPQPPAGPPAGPPADPPQPPADTDWQAEAEKWKGLARKHEDRAKANAAAAGKAAKFDQFVKALGGDGGTPPDPAELQSALAERDEMLWAMRLERTVERAARSAGADPELTAAVMFHSGVLDDLDPNADGFDDQVAEAVKKAVESNPKLADAAPPATGGGGSSGGGRPRERLRPGASNPPEDERSPDQLAEAVLRKQRGY